MFLCNILFTYIFLFCGFTFSQDGYIISDKAEHEMKGTDKASA
jgi:hypothetical protein